MRQAYVVSYVSERFYATLDPILETMRAAVTLKARRLGLEDLLVNLTGGIEGGTPQSVCGAIVGSFAFEFLHEELDGPQADRLFVEATRAMEDIGIHVVGMRENPGKA